MYVKTNSDHNITIVIDVLADPGKARDCPTNTFVFHAINY